MIIRSVTAHAFGPLAGETLTFTDGLTVIYGPNEAAKSSWHAAIYAALCGRRKGPPTVEERGFADRHQPWNRSGWVVSAEVVLEDGRRVELRQDLDGRVDCHAKDLDIGTDYSHEIINGGTPDAARWLGLDRRSFAATACVAQARMLDVLEGADGLREHLQRAAATAGADATAAAALRAIEAYRRDRVGGAQANAKGPLRTALNEQTAAADAYDAALVAYQDFETRRAGLDTQRSAAASADDRAHRLAAAASWATALVARRRADAATALDERLRTTEEAQPPVQVVQEVAAALARWEASRALPATEPTDESAGVGTGATDAELWELVGLLDRAEPTPHDAAPSALTAATLNTAMQRADAARGSVRRSRWMTTMGLALTVASVVLATVLIAAGVAAAPIAVAAVTAALTGLALAGAGTRLRRRTGLPEAEHALAAAQAGDAVARHTTVTTASLRETAQARCAELGIPADAAVVRELIRGRAQARPDPQLRSRVAHAHDDAAEQLLLIARRLGLTSGDAPHAAANLAPHAAANPAPHAAEELRRWQVEFDQHAAAAHRDGLDRARLAALLDGRALNDLMQEAKQADAAAAATGICAEDVADIDVTEDLLTAARDEARRASQRLGEAEGSLAERAAVLPSLVDAEERLARAVAEVARVRGVEETLRHASRFLAAAQERAHRDIAPALTESVRRHLATVTGGRYTDVIVRPDDLRVEVCGPQRSWRVAERLSHGTAEQMYLLLRIALAEHLVRRGERAPLILDDVIVHADADRARRLLELLYTAADARQIILFTHQPAVRDWARDHLGAAALHELAPVAVV